MSRPPSSSSLSALQSTATNSHYHGGKDGVICPRQADTACNSPLTSLAFNGDLIKVAGGHWNLSTRGRERSRCSHDIPTDGHDFDWIDLFLAKNRNQLFTLTFRWSIPLFSFVLKPGIVRFTLPYTTLLHIDYIPRIYTIDRPYNFQADRTSMITC